MASQVVRCPKCGDAALYVAGRVVCKKCEAATAKENSFQQGSAGTNIPRGSIPGVLCPKCGRSVTNPPELAGQTVACPFCKAHFVLPPSASSPVRPSAEHLRPPPPPIGTSQPEPTTSSFEGVRQTYSQAARRTFRESNSWLDVFDWRFEKYLTPWIIRLTWLATLVISALWITGILCLTIISLAPAIPERSTSVTDRERPQRQLEYEIRPPKVNMDWSAKPIIAIGSGLTACFGVLIGLLWTRVILECAIVLFNMASSLSTIEDKLRNQQG